MKALGEGTALGGPIGRWDLVASLAALAEARDGRRPVEVRVGIGPLEGPPPVRLLGYASILARVLSTDVRTLVAGAPAQVKLFSSAPKAAAQPSDDPSWALAALASALQFVGVSAPISVDVSEAAREVPADLDVRLTPHLKRWLEDRERHHTGAAKPSFFYAFEHAAPSMFGDLLFPQEDPPFRITLGGRTEGHFWAARMRVRQAVLSKGKALAPALGLIVRTVRRPWYQPLPNEPRLGALMHPAAAAAALEACVPGNTGLKSEARAVRRLIEDARLRRFADALSSPGHARQLLKTGDIGVGPRLALALGERL